MSDQPHPVYLWHVRYGTEPTELIAVRATHIEATPNEVWLQDRNETGGPVFHAFRGSHLFVHRSARVTA